MNEQERIESNVLQQELDWLLSDEIPRCYEQLTHLLETILGQFPVLDGCHGNSIAKIEKFIMSVGAQTTQDVLKAVVTVQGDTVVNADINFKFSGGDGKRGGGNGSGAQGGPHRTSVTPDQPWRLQQLQDGYNYVREALQQLQYSCTNRRAEGCSTELETVATCLLAARQGLLVPRRKTIEELLCAPNMTGLSPPLPHDTALSFYIQGHKLVLAVYQLGPRLDSVAAETPLPWLTPILAGLSSALHLTHSVKDKLSVFSEFPEMVASACSVAAASG